LGASYTSFVNGQTLTSALDVELDISVSAFSLPGESGAWFQIKGISLQEIAQANNLGPVMSGGQISAAYNIEVYGGMQAGLPLANPSQSGLLVRGQIIQCFGNWIGTDMTLDFFIVPNFGSTTAGSSVQPANLVLHWPAGMPLGTAIKNTLSTAYPNASPTPTIQVSGNLVQQQDGSGVYGDLSQLSEYARQVSRSIVGGNYLGVAIVPQGNSFLVTDGSSTNNNVTQVQFQDLIGQPTWIAPNTIQLKTVMRADIQPASQIKLPPVLTTITPQSQSQYRSSSVFQGNFFVSSVRHIGHFRQPTADAWVTVINASPQQQ
jgi:hypothetical protein